MNLETWSGKEGTPLEKEGTSPAGRGHWLESYFRKHRGKEKNGLDREWVAK